MSTGVHKTTFVAFPVNSLKCLSNQRKTSLKDGQAGVKIIDLIQVMDVNLS